MLGLLTLLALYTQYADHTLGIKKRRVMRLEQGFSKSPAWLSEAERTPLPNEPAQRL